MATGPESSSRLGSVLQQADRVAKAVVVYAFRVWFILTIASLGYLGIRKSSEALPLLLHVPILAAATALVLWGVAVLSRSDLRTRHAEGLRIWFGPNALIVLPVGILVTATSIFASVTALLLDRWPHLLESPTGDRITEGVIADFFLWHFLDLVPVLDIPETLRWDPPLDYTSGWTGLLILLFQGAVVVPMIQVVRAYLAQRRDDAAGDGANRA